MKRIEDIERLSLEDLERISGDETIQVPEGLEGRISLSVRRSSRAAYLRWIGVAASLVIIAGTAALLDSKSLEDTFDDPALAYAAIEEALSKVRPGVEIGVASASMGEEMLTNPIELVNTISNR
ncbi:MAG: hypothetical protein IJK05_06405 [Bacteroidales bacterium]|nr:hypothetical protein [Bacteroidales bacterium]